MKSGKYNDIINRFSGLKVLIAGDVMVDSYIWGKVERISPEAPVPVVNVDRREERPGGAANVALNIANLDAVPVLCSVTGNDKSAENLFQLLNEQGISTDFIIRDKSRTTTTKFRIFGNGTQLLRVDEEDNHPLKPDVSRRFLDRIKDALANQNIDVLVFQDYDKGVLNGGNIREIINLAKQFNVPVAADPKKRNFFAFEGIDLFKPNFKELTEGLNVSIDINDKEAIKNAVEKLKNKLGVKSVLLTLSEKGIYLNYEGGDFFAPAIVRKVADVSGAGDTLISVAALGLALNLEAPLMANIANIAGGLVCEEPGVVPASRDQLLGYFHKTNAMENN